MTTAIAEKQNMGAEVERVLIQGDLGKLTAEQRVAYYQNVCQSVGLNPMTRPFDYLVLSGKTVLYAKRDATDQLRKIHGVSIKITHREEIEGVYVVTAAATDAQSRVDESTGAVNINGLKGDALANALMKAETKAKRRVTLSICGLGLLDETEIETIPDAKAFSEAAPQPNLANGKGKPATGKKQADTDLVNELAVALNNCKDQDDLAEVKERLSAQKKWITKPGQEHLAGIYKELLGSLPARTLGTSEDEEQVAAGAEIAL